MGSIVRDRVLVAEVHGFHCGVRRIGCKDAQGIVVVRQKRSAERYSDETVSDFRVLRDREVQDFVPVRIAYHDSGIVLLLPSKTLEDLCLVGSIDASGFPNIENDLRADREPVGYLDSLPSRQHPDRTEI